MNHQTLLPTTAADVPEGMAERVAGACARVDDVRAAYVGLMRESRTPDGPTRDLFVVALELASPPTRPGETRTRTAMSAVRQHLPGDDRLLVLAQIALPVWRDRAVRVFERA